MVTHDIERASHLGRVARAAEHIALNGWKGVIGAEPVDVATLKGTKDQSIGFNWQRK
jgi:hypothetical protein